MTNPSARHRSAQVTQRRRLLRVGAASLAALALGRAAPAARLLADDSTGEAISPDEALERLKLGNHRFVVGMPQRPNQEAERRMQVADGQAPFAAILSCSDSRVPPELIFDQGLGDIFSVRVAGNIVEPAGTGSIEYALSHFGTSLVVVLGHSACGAISATIGAVESGSAAPGQIGQLVAVIRPAVERAAALPGPLLPTATRVNVEMGVAALAAAPPILTELVSAGRVRVVGALYDLQSGAVTFLP